MKNPLVDALEAGQIRSIRQHRGGGVTVHFGTNELRDLSGGRFPAEVWRIYEMENGQVEEKLECVVRLATRLHNAVRQAMKGTRFGVASSWVEIRARVDQAQGEQPVALPDHECG